MSTTSVRQTKPGNDEIDRGPNEEAVSTAQENVTEGYGSSRKAARISGKPDGDTRGGPRANNDHARAPSTSEQKQ